MKNILNRYPRDDNKSLLPLWTRSQPPTFLSLTLPHMHSSCHFWRADRNLCKYPKCPLFERWSVAARRCVRMSVTPLSVSFFLPLSMSLSLSFSSPPSVSDPPRHRAKCEFGLPPKKDASLAFAAARKEGRLLIGVEVEGRGPA